MFLTHPERHSEFVSVNKPSFEHPGATYIYDPAVSVDPISKEVVCASGRRVPYAVLVVASGYTIPVVSRDVGVSLADRRAEVEQWGAAINGARSLAIAGGGAVGLEIACDIKLLDPSKRVIVVSRTGQICPGYTDDVVAKAKAQLNRLGIEVVKGTVADGGVLNGGRTPCQSVPGGVIELSPSSDVESIEADVMLTAFATVRSRQSSHPSALLFSASGSVAL